MVSAEEQEEVLAPMALDRPPESAPPPRRGRKGWAAVLVLLLSGWGVFLGVWISSAPETEPVPPEQTPVGEPEPIPVPEATVPEPRETVPTPIPLPEPRLRVESVPPGATVLQQGVFLGATPVELEEWEPDQDLQFRKKGFKVKQVSAPPRAPDQRLVVELEEEVGSIRLSGDLSGAVIRIEGELVRLEPGGVLSLPLLETRIRIEKEGFVPWERTVTPSRSYQRDIQVTLEPVASGKSEEASRSPEDTGNTPVVKNSLGLDLFRPSLPLEVQLGAERGSPGRRSHEGARKVRLERPFRISVTEISNQQYAGFDPSHSSGNSGTVNLSASSLPVVGVTWAQAAQFCNWLSRQEGLPPAYVEQNGKWAFDPDPGTGYRLPTEAEWEGLLRASSGTSLYVWGDALPPPQGGLNVAGRESRTWAGKTVAGFEDPWPGPAPVEEAPESSSGLKGMAGNVREWVHDGFSAPTSGQRVSVDPMESSAARFHVIKGAGWRDHQWMDLRTARRDYAENGASDVGFRVARYLE